jgi:hypothetical protein
LDVEQHRPVLNDNMQRNQATPTLRGIGVFLCRLLGIRLDFSRLGSGFT